MRRATALVAIVAMLLLAVAPVAVLAGPGLRWDGSYGTGLNQSDDDCDFIALPFPFTYYGDTYNGVWVNSNGNVTFDDCLTDWSHPDIPDGDNVIIGTLYGDFDPFIAGDVYYNTLGSAPYRRFVVTWDTVPEYSPANTGHSTFQLMMFETGHIQFGYNGLGTDGINWSPAGEPMDVGISSGTGSFINSESGTAIPGLDGTNICYYPLGGDYFEARGPCVEFCRAELIPIQVTSTQGEFMVDFSCDFPEPEIERANGNNGAVPMLVADVNGVPVENGMFLDLIPNYGEQVVFEFLNGWIIKAPSFLLTVHLVYPTGDEIVVAVAEPLFENTYPAVGTPDAPVMPPNTPPPSPPPPDWPPPPAVSLASLLAAPEDCSAELTKLYGTWSQGTFRVDLACTVDVASMAADINGYEVADGDLVELVTTWGTERAYDMFGMWRIEAPEFSLSLTTTAPDGNWTATPDF